MSAGPSQDPFGGWTSRSRGRPSGPPVLQDGPGPMATRLNWKSARPLLLLYCDLRQRQLPFEPIPQNVAQVLEIR